MSIKDFQLLLLFGLALMAASCSTTKYIPEEQRLLTSNKINFTKDIDYDNKILLETELESFYLQEPNGNLFWFIPREWFYFKNSGVGDTCWYNDWGKNSLGEAPTYFDENLAGQTAESMEKFLRNTKGFYHAKVEYDIQNSQYQSKVIYNIDPGQRYHINSIQYIGSDSNIVNIIKSVNEGSLIDVGDPLESDAFYNEKTRIITELQNRGYANFLPNYLKINGDSTGHEFLVDVFFQVLPPLPDTIHRQFRVGKINVYTDYYTEQNLINLASEEQDSIHFYRESNNFLVKTNLISGKIFLNQGDLWSISNYNKTFRKLSELSIYRFVSLVPRREGDVINYDIYLTPHIHKYISDSGFDINYSSVNTPTGRQLFGISGNALLNIRNPFRGSEQFSLSLDNGYEFNLDSLNLSTFTFGINNNLQFPKYVNYMGRVGGIFNILNNIGLISDEHFLDIKEESSTNINLGSNYTNIRNFYTIRSINAAAIYNYSPNNRERYSIRPTNFSLNSASLEERFLQQINNNPLIINSFADNLITGFIFNEFSFVTNSLVSSSGWSRSLLGSLEVSGLEISLTNFLYKKIAGNDNTWKFSDQISYAKFIKAEIDSRFYKRLTRKNSLAFRINGGIAIPFGPNSTVPFIRQFSVGGPNSLRAWNQKELGPGGYPDLLVGTESRQAFFQQGDIKLELNAEYRFSLGWILEGALFADVGNVWTLKKDELRENANFTSTFYKQMAIAMGYGMRFDFEYFNIRFDFAYRIRNPFPDEETGKYFYSWDGIKDQGFGNLQIAINHPF